MIRKFVFFVAVLFSFTSCGKNGEYKQTIVDFLEIDKNGVRTDLNVEISDLQIRDFTVIDSIAVLEERSKAIKDFRVGVLQRKLDKANSSLAKSGNGSFNFKPIFENRVKKLTRMIEDEESQAKQAAKRYDDVNKNQILCKLVTAKVKFMNPRLNTNQEFNGQFIFSANEIKCLRRVDGLEEKIRSQLNQSWEIITLFD